MTVPSRGRPDGRRLFAEPLAVKVPEITAWFWVVKILTTAAGEATSDALKTLGNIKGGAAEILLFAIGILLQFRSRRYTAVAYWFLAYAIATFGTGVADFLHLDVGIPYAGTTVLWAVILAAVFGVWYRSEGTLSIHSITTTRRELFYWATVFATFALGTALGDFTASELGLGYFASAILFTVVILVPAAAYRWFGMNSIAAFWFAYVVTRPLGASYADYISKPLSWSGIGFGDAQTAIVLGSAIVVCVVYLVVARPDVPLTVATAGPDPGGERVLLSRSGPSPEGWERDEGAVGGVAGGSDLTREVAPLPRRRHLGGWPPREPATSALGRPRDAQAPAPPVSPRRPPADVGAVRNVRPRPPEPPEPPARPAPPAPSASPGAPGPPVGSGEHPQAAPSLRPRPPAAGPPPIGASARPRGPRQKPEQFDPLLRDLLAWGLVEPGVPAEDAANAATDSTDAATDANAPWHLAEDAQHRLEDLNTQRESRQSHLMYFDRVCAGCRRRQLTRLHDGAYLCDPCLSRALAPPAGGSPGSFGSQGGTSRNRRG